MKIHGVVPVAALVLGAVLSAPTYASSISTDSSVLRDNGVLFAHPQLNQNLGAGEYGFASLNLHYNSSFVDRWQFTVAQNSTASVGTYDAELGFGQPTAAQTAALSHFPKVLNALQQFDTKKIFDTGNLTFGVYNSAGDLLGQAGENQTLSGLSLMAGQWYTLAVSGRVTGLVGSAYFGTLNTEVTAVPIGASAPMLGSALALLGFCYRKRRPRDI